MALFLIVTGNVLPGMPRSALGIDWLLSLVLIGGSRFALHPCGFVDGELTDGKASASSLWVQEMWARWWCVSCKIVAT